ncbi:FecR family protein [Agriterribacter sp.]|uniref:FecR family protein n=1 Tax=Agriterribacter sp. TaxID=2821509 RepID=UPI002CF6D111|nr:FecR family protein [Agriterribacter sp.]HRO47119.1 FecR family protein [Agriterribacter sp.]HRQ17876.1 FecR family protein [Agriterribacter sp.]
MKDKIDFDYLLQKRIRDILSDEEKTQLLEALNDPANVHKLSRIVEEWYHKELPELFVYDEAKLKEMIRVIVANDAGSMDPFVLKESDQKMETSGIDEDEAKEYMPGGGSKIRFLKAPWIRYAAAAALFIGAGFFYYNIKKDTPGQQATVTAPVLTRDANDVLPGTNKAVLTLSNGEKVELDDKGQQVINDGDLAIRISDGALAYSKTDVVVYNTMTTPKGGQYKLMLPDGTTVWLNASSSITYPTAFPGNTRAVAITGEAYFEVAKNPLKPFTVRTYEDEITVKGTSFNVNSYDDEAGIKTSLLEGLVQVNGMLLTPGNAYMGGKVTRTDVDKDLAWKNGVFNFHQVKLKYAMRQIARWYDVEVKYEGNVDRIELGGEIGRNLTLQQVLNGLQDRDLHFKLEGKTLTVY